MGDVWLILLDSSGSMGRPFSSDYRFRGDVEHIDPSQYPTKLAAAKEHLIRALHGLPASDVAIVAFASAPSLMSKGHSSSPDAFRPDLDRITAGGGTNIADALLFALHDVVRDEPYDYRSILLISDGLSNAGDSEGAAAECRSSGVPISTILIDPTPEGEHFAKEVLRGPVRAVASPSDLEAAVIGVAKEHRAAAETKPTTSLLGFVAVLTACVALTVTLTGVFTAAVEKPTIAIPITFSAVSFMANCILFFIAFARETLSTGIYISPTEWRNTVRYKFEPNTRRAAMGGGILCLLFSGWLGYLAYNNGGANPPGSEVTRVKIAAPDNRSKSSLSMSDLEGEWLSSKDHFERFTFTRSSFEHETEAYRLRGSVFIFSSPGDMLALQLQYYDNSIGFTQDSVFLRLEGETLFVTDGTGITSRFERVTVDAN